MINPTLPWTKTFRWLVVLVSSTAAAFGAEQSRLPLEVIPQPHEIKFTGAAFEPNATNLISVSDRPADHFAARLVQEAMRETHGINNNIVLTPQDTTNLHQLWVGLKDQTPDHPALPAPAKKEGYVLAEKMAQGIGKIVRDRQSDLTHAVLEQLRYTGLGKRGVGSRGGQEQLAPPTRAAPLFQIAPEQTHRRVLQGHPPDPA